MVLKMKKISNHNTQSKVYEDGAEDFLDKLFSEKNELSISQNISELLANNPTWPILYHLSPQRHMILEWYPFKDNSTIFEIGAGCGAITGLLCKRARKLFANELDKKRAKIIKNRFSDHDNLEVIQSNFQKIIPAKYLSDYVISIGVLEYSGKYMTPDNSELFSSFQQYLIACKRLIKPNGKLILAIENKIGLKYLSGMNEDHYSLRFESLENYPHYNGIYTFTKSELDQLFLHAGYSDLRYYYPFPDYKLPNLILNEEGFDLNISTSSFAKIEDYSHKDAPLFNEIILADNLRKSKLISFFSNSFLVEASI